MKICINCGKETSNPKFCSRSCSATYNNKVFPKRAPEGSCKKCGIAILKSATYCSRCKAKILGKFHGKDMTLEQAIYQYHHPNSAFALVRSRARRIMQDSKACETCGYDRHVQINHKKPISQFSLDTLLSVINDKSNLMALCPNCHWEYEHPLL